MLLVKRIPQNNLKVVKPDLRVPLPLTNLSMKCTVVLGHCQNLSNLPLQLYLLHTLLSQLHYR